MGHARRSTFRCLAVGTFVVHCIRGGALFGGYTAIIPRLDRSTAAPFVDGALDSTYGATIPILYEPRFAASPARLAFLSTSTHVYVCVTGMPRKMGSVEPFLSVAFDTSHDGGSLPQADDIVFNIAEDGTKSAARGNGSGSFADDGSLAGWSAARASTSGSWSAELRIPLALLSAPESPREYPKVGIHVRHNWLRSVGDDFVWPPTGIWNVPSTWGDMAWSVASTPGETRLEVDVYRVTQGLDYDTVAGVAYDLIAGKDTLLRVQLFTFPGPAPDVTFAACHFQRQVLSGPPRPRQTVPISVPPTPKVNTYSYGYFNGKPVFEFWIPGRMLFESGTYGFELEIGLEGIPGKQTVLLGHKVFKGSSDLRVLLMRAELADDDARYQAFDFAVNASVQEGLKHFQRTMPIRSSGMGNIFSGGGSITSTTPGFRYSYMPSTLRCPRGTSFADCADKLARTQANEALLKLNAELAKKGAADRFDHAIALVAQDVTTGGRCCVGSLTPPNASRVSVDDNLGLISGIVMAHETSHSLGEVRAESPHYVCISGGHTKSPIVDIFNNLKLVDTLAQVDRPTPLPLMVPGASAFEPAWRLFHEGREWNDLRSTSLAPKGGAFAPGESKFHLVGFVSPQGFIAALTSARVDDLDLELTAIDDSGPYDAVFLGPMNNEIARFPFAVRTSDDDADPQQVHTVHLSLTFPLPPGSAGIGIVERDSNIPVYSQVFSAGKPSVLQVIASPSPQIPGIVLSWTATDPENQGLTHDVYFQRSPNDVPQLVALGLRDTSFFFPTELAPPSQEARFIVEASDGYNTARATSNPVSIDPKPPVVRIAEPNASSNLLAGKRAALLAEAYDLTDGALTGAAVRWTSSADGFLGTGSEVHAALSAGFHTLFVEASASSGLGATASADVFVQSDSDGDQLPDSYEQQSPCLSPNLPDGDGDPDGDGLTSKGELDAGTDPCRADSDADGFSDGDEARQGSDPLSPQSIPAPDLIFLSTDEVDLGACPNPGTQSVNVSVFPNTSWNVSADSDWIAVARVGPGGGCLEISARCDDLPQGHYEGLVLVSAAGGQLRTARVQLDVAAGPTGGLRRPGDCNQDGSVDISDGICLFGYLFLGSPRSLPCGDGTRADPANLRLLNHNGAGTIDISDGIALLSFLFSSGPPPASGTQCTPIQGCTDRCGN